MKKQVLKSLLIVAFFFTLGNVFAQQKSDLGFSYQAVARDASGLAINNKAIVVEISIRKGGLTGITLWQETHEVKTNNFGLFSIVIGKGNTTGVGKLDSFKEIDWSHMDIFTGVRADFGNGLLPMGNVQLQSIPYAFIADSALAAPRFNLKELLDVNSSNIQKNDILRWDGTQWKSVNFDGSLNTVYAKYKADSLQLNTNLLNIYNELKSKASADSLANATLLTTQISNVQAKAIVDSVLFSTNLTKEVTNRTSAINDVKSKAVSDSTALRTLVNTNIFAITSETSRATTVETNLSNSINTIKTKSISDSTALKGYIDGKTDRSLSNLSNVSTARTNLGVAIGTNVQAYDVDLSTYAGISPSANIQTLLGSANYSAARTTLGLAIGTDIQAFDADLTTYAGITPSANIQALLGSADYATARTNLGLGTMATESSSDYLPIIGGTLTGGLTGTTATFTGTISAGDIQTGSANAFYFGDPSVNGTWRILRSGDNLVYERRESGSWVTKLSMQP